MYIAVTIQIAGLEPFIDSTLETTVDLFQSRDKGRRPRLNPVELRLGVNAIFNNNEP